ncbi:MAG: tetratricopeptide repeat protein [Bacteroidales bacterium]|nr:tetratricopeptide repeat protein [Bacteroidales bacterium]
MRTYLILVLLLAGGYNLFAQNFRKLNRDGVSQYRENAYDNAELSFRKAREVDSTALEANYNIANTLYKQEKYDEAAGIFNELSVAHDEKDRQADIFHNLGNSMLQKQQYQESIEAYKKALRIRPEDEETRYNLAYAQAKLQQQQQEQQQQKDQDQQEKKQDEQNNQDQKDQDQQEDQQQEQNDQQQEQNEQQSRQSGEEQDSEAMKSLSREDMERLLQAIQQQEKMVQNKLEQEKAKAAKIKTEKDW